MQRKTYVSETGFMVDQELGIRAQLIEKIFDSTENDLKDIKEELNNNKFLAEELDDGFKKLEKEIEDIHHRLRSLSEKIFFEFIEPIQVDKAITGIIKKEDKK